MKYGWIKKSADVQEFIENIVPSREKVVLNEAMTAINHQVMLFESKTEAFESFRRKIGNREIDESVSENYVLALVELSNHNTVKSIDVTDKNPRDLCDCVNCSWGKMKPSEDFYFVCDNCEYTEYMP